MEPILRVRNLHKHFRSHWVYRRIEAVRDASFDIYPGEIFGLLGHNGAGKTTTMKCILGLIRLTQGEVQFRGQPLTTAAQRADMGYLPELPYFYDHLTVRETLEFLASLTGLRSRLSRGEFAKHVDSTLDRVGLTEKRKAPVRSLSKGLQQRLGLAQAIVNDPKLLFLDEPFSGLDPIGRREFRNIILDLKHAGTTIALSSHVLSDVQTLCDRVLIMARGHVETTFSIADVGQLFGERFELVIESVENETLVSTLRNLEDADNRSTDPRGHSFCYSDYDKALEAFVIVSQHGVRVREFRSSSPDLESIFVSVTERARGGAQQAPAISAPNDGGRHA
ncbi:MAG: ABC transporter ATP-binding protein [Deltaproteobacteria bacterium]|nr:ABC transporter ATP-binding protein [Deltaproteobacteria bacterium]